MRTNLNKRNFTRAERIFGRILQENRISFKTKIKINGREIDFLIGKVCIEIDGHEQDAEKNNELVRLGYTPIHIHNSEIYNNLERIKKYVNKI